ncbi:hypothetical protein F4775DRAFT_474760 [Biscogniauxia sp. FL1348]|nr:hypothetical protein F4775DRAFT_474760 [Biscogniauxia sp. FL1348]
MLQPLFFDILVAVLSYYLVSFQALNRFRDRQGDIHLAEHWPLWPYLLFLLAVCTFRFAPYFKRVLSDLLDTKANPSVEQTSFFSLRFLYRLFYTYSFAELAKDSFLPISDYNLW